jgi:uncharacterized protein
MAAATLSYPVRRPRWILTYQGVNITADISQMVTEISWTSKEEDHSDEMEVTLEDRDRRWQGPWLPQRGDVTTLLVGYDSTATTARRTFQVDELELKGPPDTFHLKCIAAGITPSIRTPRSVAFEGQTLLGVANSIAASHGMTVVGAPQNINVSWQRLTQRHETDLNFLHRLARAHNYDFSMRGTQLVFYSRTQLESQSPLLTIQRQQTKTFEFKTRTHRIYRSASVAYQNPLQKRLITAGAQDSSAPTGDDLHIVTRCENLQQAQLKAVSALHSANMMEVSGRLETEGNPLLVGGINIQISGFKAWDGTYLIRASKHRVERSSGYSTEIEVRQLASAGAAVVSS